MAILPIIKTGDPVLRRKNRELKPADLKKSSTRKLLKDMVETMRASGGVGLAASQVGVSVKAIVVECWSSKRYPGSDEFPLEIFINPKITAYSKKTVTDWEGCLSIPGYRGLVPRAHTITFTALEPDGKKIARTVSGFLARVIQHETDHTMGILFIDRMTDLSSFTCVMETE